MSVRPLGDCRNPDCRAPLRPRTGQRGYHGAHGYCRGCFDRWRKAGYPQSGPPPCKPRGGPRTTGAIAANEARIRQAAERAEDYAELRSWGVAPADAATRIGVSAATGERYERRWRRQEHQREGVAA